MGALGRWMPTWAEFVCKIKGHRWEYFEFMECYKCSRCGGNKYVPGNKKP